MNDPSPLARVRTALLDDRRTLRAAVERIPVSLRHQKPAPDRWSVADVLEHLALVEGRVVGLLASWLPTAPVLDAGPDADTTPLDRVRLRNRLVRFDAPGPIQPSGSINADAALAALERSRAELLALLDRAEAERRDLAQISRQHPVLGQLDGYQWIAAVGGHEERHAAQILEIAAALDVPAA